MPKHVGPSGRLVDVMTVDFEANAEPWSTYTLEDGSVVKLRTVIKNVLRLEGEFDHGGNPIYSVQTDVIFRVVKSKIRGEPTVTQKPSMIPAGRDPSVG